VVTIEVPSFSLVTLIGPSGSGKSSFAQRFFRTAEIISSDFCRKLVSDQGDDLNATADAFDVLYFIASKRLRARSLPVIDAANVKAQSRNSLIALAQKYECPAVAIVLSLQERICIDCNSIRTDRVIKGHDSKAATRLETIHPRSEK
jgi:protein phosphatase